MWPVAIDPITIVLGIYLSRSRSIPGDQEESPLIVHGLEQNRVHIRGKLPRFIRREKKLRGTKKYLIGMGNVYGWHYLRCKGDYLISVSVKLVSQRYTRRDIGFLPPQRNFYYNVPDNKLRAAFAKKFHFALSNFSN